MEDKKDTTRESRNPNGQYVQGQTETEQPQGLSYLARKSEKLTTALYMVTDTLSDKEPIKWRAREAGVEVLSDIAVCPTVSVSERMSILRGVLKKIDRVISFIDITASTRMITEMNSSILRKEYLLLKGGVEHEWSNTHDRSRPALSEHFFDVPRDPALLLESESRGAPSTTPPASKENAKQYTSVARPEAPASRPEVQAHPQVTELPRIGQMNALPVTEPQKIFTPTPRPTPPPAPLRPHVLVDREIASYARPDFARDDRRKIILALLKQKPSVTVGDIAKSIPGVSEKTIQRELLSMVSDGVLVKRGERRWSTYSLRVE